MFNYCSHPERTGILYPDFSFWGNEGRLLAAEDGRSLGGSDRGLHHLQVLNPGPHKKPS